tara:strand:+ start:631 stop:2133 length:1503 start_codon:yes stop_codon:yes gene_type:complete
MSKSVTDELSSLFEKLEFVAKESKLEEKKRKDYVETTEKDLSNLFTELEKVSQETKKPDENGKDKLNEFASLFEKISHQEEDELREHIEEEYPEDLPNDVELTPDDDPTDDVELTPDDDPTDDVSGKDSLDGWIKKDVDDNDKKVKAIEQLFASLKDISIDEPIKQNIVEKTLSPIEEIEKLIKSKKSKKSNTIKKAIISTDEQKFMSKVLDDIDKISPEEKPIDVNEQSFPNSIKDSLLTPDEKSKQRKATQSEDSITRLRKEFEQFRTLIQLQLESRQNAFSGGGSGEVKIQNMDDIDIDTVLVDKNVLRYNATTGKFDGVALETEDLILETGSAILLDGTDSDGSDAESRIDLEDGTFGGTVDLSGITQDIVPDQTNTRNLGSSSKRFKELFLAGQTIDLGGATISSDGTGTVSISSDGVTLPSNSKVGSDTIAKAGTNGKTSIDVDFFSRAGGTSTANATFKFQSVGNSYVFTDSGTFTLAAGTALEDQNPELFTF